MDERRQFADGIDPDIQAEPTVPGEKGRKFIRLPTDHGHGVRFEPFERTGEIEDGLGARADDCDWCAAELRQVSGDIPVAAPVNTPDAAG